MFLFQSLRFNRRRSAALAVIVTCLAILPSCDRSKTSTTGAASATTAPAAALNRVDAILATAWTKAGVTPAPEVDDATFMRRVYLDLTGVVPTVAQARAYLEDDAPGRSERLIDTLLKSPRFAKHWTNYWDDVLMQSTRNPQVDRVAFRQWIHAQLKSNVGYDEMVRQLLTARGVNSVGGKRNLAGWELDEPPAEGVNGAVNFILTGNREPQNLAGTTSRVFLGVQIQCAECHDHPTEKWTQKDFERFTSAFMRVDGRRLDRGKQMGIRRIELDDTDKVRGKVRKRMKKTGYGDEPPTALDGTPLDPKRPREALASWMTAKDNPWFARAVVNRMWAYFLGRGFVEPIDEMTDSNPPMLPELLTALTEEFTQGGFDLRELMRTITTSSAYRRDARGAAPLWSSFALRPMNDTQLLDSLVTSSGIESVLEEVVGERLTRLKINMRRQFRFAFDVDEEASADTFTGTTPQALMLLNGPLTSAGSSALDGSTLGDAARAGGGIEATLEHLYLATLSRKPEADEVAHWKKHVRAAAPGYDKGKRRTRGRGPVARVYRKKRLRDLSPADVAYEDVLWALLNSSEFFFIH